MGIGAIAGYRQWYAIQSLTFCVPLLIYEPCSLTECLLGLMDQ
jgi:hypothetical protein